MASKMSSAGTQVIYVEGKHPQPFKIELTPNVHADNEFKDGQLYCFQGVIDKNWMDLYGAQLADGTQIRTLAANGQPAQFWRAYKNDDGTGGHRVETSVTNDGSRVVTMENKFQNNKVVLKAYNGETAQSWYLIKVPGTEFYHIVNGSNGKAMSNHGSGMNIRCVDADINDVHQQWKIELPAHN